MQGSLKYHFWVFGMTRPGIEARSPGSFANTLAMMSMSGNYKVAKHFLIPQYIFLILKIYSKYVRAKSNP